MTLEEAFAATRSPTACDSKCISTCDRRRELLQARAERTRRLDAGERPDFLAQTKSVREGDWRIAPLPKDLECRRAEITGPVERKMIINALNSGADSYMTDFEDSNAPNWHNQITGHLNLKEAVRRTIAIEQGDKTYKLNDKVATLIVRPRGWHLDEKDLLDFRPEQLITETGLRNNINVGIHYLGSWLSGNGCVPIHNLMEDAATAEISRSQVCQWIRSPKGKLDDGRNVTAELVRELIPQELGKVKSTIGGDTQPYERAARIFEDMSTSEHFTEFLTLPLYEEI